MDTALAAPRMAAGVLFVDGDKVLLVRKTYGNRWDIPGGYVDIGESPRAACEREILEELGLKRQVRGLLAVDWAPSEKEGDKLLWIFDCGALGDDESHIQLDGEELDHYQWVPADKLDDYAIPRLARRLSRAFSAGQSRTGPLYLEHGEPPITPSAYLNGPLN